MSIPPPIDSNASLEPIPYATVPTDEDLRWIVRYVGLFIAAKFAAPWLSTGYYAMSMPLDQILRVGLVGIVGLAITIAAAIGLLSCRRIAFPVLIATMLATTAYNFLLASSMPMLSVPLWAYLLPALTSVAYAALLALIWRRSERRCILVPAPSSVCAELPASDDLRWFLRMAGAYLLIGAIGASTWFARSIALSGSAAPMVWELAQVGSLAGRWLIAICLLFGRGKALLWLAALALLAMLDQMIGSSDVASFIMRLTQTAITVAFALALYWRIERVWPKWMQAGWSRCRNPRATFEAIRTFGVRTVDDPPTRSRQQL